MRLQLRKKWQSPAVEGALILLTGPGGFSPQSLFLGPQLRGQVKQRPQEPGRLPEDSGVRLIPGPLRDPVPAAAGPGEGRRKRRSSGKEEAAAPFPQVSSRASVSPAVM